MFDDKNKTTSFDNQGEAELKINKNEIPIHTMQNDLDILEGRVMRKEETEIDDVQDNAAGDKTERIVSGPFSNSTPPQTDIYLRPEKKEESVQSVQSSKVEGDGTINREESINSQLLSEPLKRNNTLLLSLIAVIVLIFASGGYYFWITRSPGPIAQPQSPELPEQPIIEVPSEKFSVDKPNYLNIEIEKITPEEISKILAQTASEVKESKINTPIEFLVADNINNPIAFSRFAYLFQLNFSSDVLSTLDEKFSLYLYNDKENIRSGIIVDIKDKEMTAAEMAKEEKTLVSDLSNLFIDASGEKTNIPFNDSSHKDYSIRYANLEEQGITSIDYSIVGNRLFIGTSKDSIRAMLDKAGVLE